MAKLFLTILCTFVLARCGESCNEGLKQKIMKAWEGQNSGSVLEQIKADGGTFTVIVAAQGVLDRQIKCTVTKFNSDDTSTDYDLLMNGTTVKHAPHSIAWSENDKSLYNIENGSRVDRYCTPPVQGVYGCMLCKQNESEGMFKITMGTPEKQTNKEGENQMKEFLREYMGPYQEYPNPCPVSTYAV